MKKLRRRDRRAKRDRRRRERSGHRRRRSRCRASRSRSRSSRSPGSSSSTSSGFNATGQDDQKFRKIARTQPGVQFASFVAACRTQLGSVGMDYDIGANGPVLRKWLDSVLLARVPRHGIGKDKYETLRLLVQTLDEVMAGRVLEMSDILASHLRYLALGVETGQWSIAQELLTYAPEDHALIHPHVFETAVRESKRRRTREEQAAAATRAPAVR